MYGVTLKWIKFISLWIKMHWIGYWPKHYDCIAIQCKTWRFNSLMILKQNKSHWRKIKYSVLAHALLVDRNETSASLFWFETKLKAIFGLNLANNDLLMPESHHLWLCIRYNKKLKNVNKLYGSNYFSHIISSAINY